MIREYINATFLFIAYIDFFLILTKNKFSRCSNWIRKAEINPYEIREILGKVEKKIEKAKKN